ncbi:MAG: alpha/beta hydrolase [Chloroflexota bacterium]
MSASQAGHHYGLDAEASPDDHPESEQPHIDTLLFAQHGWADNNQAMLRFGEAIASPGALVIAPNLGYVRTWLRIEPLIETAERAAADALAEHPQARIRAVGHSMGGLIWVELLTRHPEWLARTDRLVLIGCPVGGAELAGFLDPLGLTIGRDLRVNRRARAEAIAATVPTLTIVGDWLGQHDGTVSHESARLVNARFVLTPSATHAGLRNSPVVIRLVRAFFEQPDPPPVDLQQFVARLKAIPSIRPAEPQLMRVAKVTMMLADGSTIRTQTAMPGVDLVFLADCEGRCLYAGAAPSVRGGGVQQALAAIRETHHAAVLAP